MDFLCGWILPHLLKLAAGLALSASTCVALYKVGAKLTFINVAPSVVTDQHRWTIYHSKVNLPAALNDPRLAKRESDFFTKTWGLDFVDTEVIPSFYLPQISKEHFTVYQQEISQVISNLEVIGQKWNVSFLMYSDRCEVVSHCGFNLLFPDDYWWWTSFRVSVDHLYVFFTWPLWDCDSGSSCGPPGGVGLSPHVAVCSAWGGLRAGFPVLID